MADLTLYHIAPSRSSVILWMLEEIGEPYEVKVLNMKKGENREPAYLAVNPMGKVPALKHGDMVMTESAAICCYLADAFPKASLAPPIGDPRRGPYLQWLFFGPSCVEPAIMDKAYKRAEAAPRTAMGYGDYDTVMDVLAKAVSRGPYLVGDALTAADLIIGSGLRWGMAFKLIPERLEFTAYTARLVERPALKRAEARDKEFAAAA